MIVKPKGYEEAQAYGDFETLELGGHICKVLDTEIAEYGWGNVLILSFDIAEGSKSDGFYKRNFDSQGENKKWKGTFRQNLPVENPETESEQRTLRSFKTLINSIEESNSGYKWNWDEASLKGKLFGGVFGRKEYDFDGKQGFYTTCRFIKNVDAIKAGVEVPDDFLLNKKPDDPLKDFVPLPNESNDVPF